MEIRTGKGILVVAILLAMGFIGWQLADDGLQFAKGRLPVLLGDAGASTGAIAFRARYEEMQRTYWLVTTSAGVLRVVVLYGPDRRPYDARVL